MIKIIPESVTAARSAAPEGQVAQVKRTQQQPTVRDGASVVEVGPEISSHEAAHGVIEGITEQLASQPSGAMNAIRNLDATRIQRLLLED